MNRLRSTRFLLGIALATLLASGLFAQVAGRLSGTVVDPTGAAIPGASVKLYLRSGTQALLTTTTTTSGTFAFPTVRPEIYDVEVEASGFGKYITRGVGVNPIRETALPVIKLEVQSAQQVIEVAAEAMYVQTSESAVSSTVTREMVMNLPVLDRQVSALFQTQAGVSNSRGPTVINGMRTSAANVTLDGINIQDNFIRTNSLDYMPMRTTIEQIAEVTISTSNTGSTIGGGAAQVVLSTRSGTNQYHGSLYWYNRNDNVSSNDWFNNRAGVERENLNQNQFGGSIGGRIIKDKLFFFTNYEGLRLKQSSSTLRTVLTDPARAGVFTYRDTGNVVRTADVLRLRNAQVNGALKPFIDQMPRGNSTDAGDQLNTTGYLFNARDNMDRNQFVYKGDYYLSPRHNFTGTYNYANEKLDRPDLGTFLSTVPPVYNDNHNNLLSLAWRWTPGATLTNEVRAGFNLGPGSFAVRNEYPRYQLDGLYYSNAVNTFMAQGRATDTYTFQDNASWNRGNHELSFGFQSQLIRSAPYNDAGILPTYTLGISANNRNGFTAADLPGARALDINNANSLYTSLAGIISSASQTFNVTSRDSGFVPMATNLRHFTYDTYAGYLQDKWKVNRQLTLTLGLRYEYWTRLDERDSLIVLPVLKNNDVRATLLDPNASFSFAGSSAGRPFYNRDANNFAPNFGFAWNIGGNAKTVVRGGYGISFINDDTITAVRNNVNTNDGLNSTAQRTGLVADLANPPAVPVPPFKVPRTQADNYAVTPTAALGMPDPNLRTPYVQQYSFGIQHDVRGFILEARYVGNHGTKLLRAFDYNQVVVKENGFLEDFIRARNNGFLAQRTTGRFDPVFNSGIPGSQQLRVFPQLASGGLLTNATVQARLQTGEVGSLAEIYQTNGLNGNVNFFRNPLALGANTIANSSNSTYNSLQLEVRKRVRGGLQMQANYTYGKVMSDLAGDGQTRFEPYLDFDNGRIERSRTPFDLTHAFKTTAVYELPYGKGKRWSGNDVLNQIFGGWMASGFLTWQSGPPFSINSARGTLNRGGRSGSNTASIVGLTKSDLDQKVGGLFMTGRGPFMVDPSIIGPDGRGVGPDGGQPFSGQIFHNPGPGDLGNLQRRYFSGPSFFGLDASLLKTFAIGERHSVQFRAEVFNLPNHPSFYFGQESINSVNFGRITSTLSDVRIMQFGLYYRF